MGLAIKYERIRTLPEIALDIHVTATGAMDRTYGTGDAEQIADVEYLRGRLKQWEPTVFPRSAKFDAAVKALCEAALEEIGASV